MQPRGRPWVEGKNEHALQGRKNTSDIPSAALRGRVKLYRHHQLWIVPSNLRLIGK